MCVVLDESNNEKKKCTNQVDVIYWKQIKIIIIIRKPWAIYTKLTYLVYTFDDDDDIMNTKLVIYIKSHNIFIVNLTLNCSSSSS